MDFNYTPRVLALQARLKAFFQAHIDPNVQAFEAERQAYREAGKPFEPSALVDRLKPLAQQAGLWNLFLPRSAHAPEGLSNLEYAPLAEMMGRLLWSSEVFNCSAPDTGNMETLERYGTEEHKARWLAPLLRGEIRSAFLMTEPAVASSDATNVQCSIERQGDEWVINGTKWWSSGAGSPRCQLFIVMGKTDPSAARHKQQSMVLVPSNTPGVTLKRSLNVFGFDDAAHGGHMEIELRDVRVPVSNMLLGEGRGFEIAQGRLGPGRIHHCMRSIGVAEWALERMCERGLSRVAFGRALSEQGVWRERIAEARCRIDQARLLTLMAADKMDKVGNKAAQAEIAMIKVVAPSMAGQVLDWAMQMHGGAGLCQDFALAYHWAHQRVLRLADGPDEVHRNSLAKLELAKYRAAAASVEMPVTRGC
jgi:acyl-CoA dehydrogenase